jgi:hypothetical protein
VSVRLEKAKANIDSDIRRLDEPYRTQLRNFMDDRSRQRAIEEELREGGGGYRFSAGIRRGEFGEDPGLTE